MLHTPSLVRTDRCPLIKTIRAPTARITRIWEFMIEGDRDYVNRVIGEVHELARYKVNWALLDALSDFWDSENAVFNINGNELTPTLE